uniref:N-acetyltransferase n=1 Tax=Panagrolaimus sp. JU765 TaxID=591449 RepID=A0AC34RCC5_9BILA
MEKLKTRDIREFMDSPLNLKTMKPLCTSTPVIPQNRKRKMPTADDDPKQTVLDAGQKKIGMTTCKECGMVYSVDVVKDQKAHEEYHNRFTDVKYFKVDTRTFNGWKKSAYNEVIYGKTCGTLFRIESTNKTSIKKRFESVIKEVVDPELGICSDVPVFSKEKQQIGFIFVADNPKFIGAVVVTRRVTSGTLMPTKKTYKDNSPTGGFIEVERIWVHPKIRKQRLATKILDVVRRLYSPGAELMRTRIVFTEPNDVCISFAKNFLGKKDYYMIYDPEEAQRTVSVSSMSDNPAKRIKIEGESVRTTQSSDRTSTSEKENILKPVKVEKDENSKKVLTQKSNTKNTKKNMAVQPDFMVGNPKIRIKEKIQTLVIEDENVPLKLEMSEELC